MTESAGSVVVMRTILQVALVYQRPVLRLPSQRAPTRRAQAAHQVGLPCDSSRRSCPHATTTASNNPAKLLPSPARTRAAATVRTSAWREGQPPRGHASRVGYCSLAWKG